MRSTLDTKSTEKVIAITGAAGQVSYALLFMLIQSKFILRNNKLNLKLIDDSEFLNKLEALKMELLDCAFPQLGKIEVTSDYHTAFNDCDWIIFNGGFHHNSDMSKQEFIKKNSRLISTQAVALNSSRLKKNTKVLMVANPVNMNCCLLSLYAPKITKKSIFGLSYLDQQRAVSVLSSKTGAPVSTIKNVFAWGNHSSTVYPSIEKAVLNKGRIISNAQLDNWHRNYLVPHVQGRGESIIKLRGHNSAGSAAKAIIDTLMLLEGRMPKQPFSVICCSNGEYGIKKNIWFSFPCVRINGVIKILKNIPLTVYSMKMLKLSEDEILSDINMASGII